MDSLLTVEQAADELEISVKHVWRLVAAGKISRSGADVAFLIDAASVADFKREREQLIETVNRWSRELSELGTPLE